MRSGISLVLFACLTASASEPPFMLRSIPSAQHAAIEVALDAEGLLQITRYPGSPVRLALSPTESILVTMTPFEVLAPGAQVVIADAETQTVVEPPLVRMWKGKIADDPDSIIFISESQLGINGFITSPNQTHIISSGRAGESPTVLWTPEIHHAAARPAAPYCGGEVLAPGQTLPPPQRDILTDRSTWTPRRFNIAVDCDTEFTDELFGGDVNAAQTYALVLFAAASTVYESQLEVSLGVSHLKMWRDVDPFNGSVAGDMLQQFANYSYYSNLPPRDISHLLSARAFGGLAYVRALCGYNASGFSSSLNGYFPYPVQDHRAWNWDIKVLCHELGHNFGSGHTHDPSHYVPVIDGCGLHYLDPPQTQDCSQAWGGTIMSYCQLCPGAMSNIAMRFGPRVTERMRSFIDGDARYCGELIPLDGCARWSTFTQGFDSQVRALTTWDPDADGPQQPVLIAGGSFTNAGAQPVSRIAAWAGSQWQQVGNGLSSVVTDLHAWDPDGPGPRLPTLIACGSFLASGSTPLIRIAMWDGKQWSPLGQGIFGPTNALGDWDPDGTGPLPPRLIAGGGFLTAGDTHAARIAMFDGDAWSPIGSGVGGAVNAITSWDPDSGGPLPPRLIVAGSFTTAGDTLAANIAQWDGKQWQALGAGLNGPALSLVVHDSDGSGPQASSLIVGGQFTQADGIDAARVARWDGTSWHPLAQGISESVHALIVWDADGSSAQRPQLIAGGNFVSRWDGTTWHAEPPAFSARSFTTWRNPNDPVELRNLIAGGVFTNVGVLPAANIAILPACSPTPPPCPGDANNDNLIDGRDLSVLLSTFLTTVPPGTAADFNNDGLINGSDLSVLLSNFGCGIS